MLDVLLFACVLVIVSFAVSYTTDLVRQRRVVWWPRHAREMATGTFLSGLVTKSLFAYFRS